MPKLITRPPKYARHKASGQAVVKINGKVRYLGPWNSVESKVRYQEAISAWAAEQDSRPSATVSIKLPESDAVISELLAAYMRHAQTYYLKNGVPTSMVHLVRSIVRLWKDSFASVLVRDIRPSHLKALQKRMVTEGQSRGYVNKVTSCSKSMFRWAVENDLAPPEVWQALLAVRGLARGRTEARETEPIGPVEDSVVDACLPCMPTVVASMVQLQRFTGMRPGEACSIRPMDVDRTKEIWLYRPESHKTQHHGRGRVIAIGPRAQEILRPYLLRPADAYCFSPSETTCSRRRSVGERYSKDSYRRCIARAIERANKARTKQNEPALPSWAPNQLRHSLGTEVRQRFGLEAAQVVLGHSKADVTQVYAERDQRLAVEVARQVG